MALMDLLLAGVDPVSLLISIVISMTLSYAASQLTKPHQTTPAFKSMQSIWGRTWPIVYNNFRVAGQVIQAGPVSQHHHKSKKGGNQYTQTFAVGICEGPKQLGRIWADNKVIYDPRPITAPDVWTALTEYGAGDIVIETVGLTVPVIFTATVDGASGASEPSWNTATDALTRDGTQVWIASPYVPRTFVGKAFNFAMEVYQGTEDQLANAALEELVGTGNQPAYRGLMYVVFEDFPLTARYGNRIPNFEFEVTSADVPEIFFPLFIDTGGAPLFNYNGPQNLIADRANNKAYSFWSGNAATSETSSTATKLWTHSLTNGSWLATTIVSAMCGISGNDTVYANGSCLGADGFLYFVTSNGFGVYNTLKLSKVDPATMAEVAATALTVAGLPFTNLWSFRIANVLANGINHIGVDVDRYSEGAPRANSAYFEVFRCSDLSSRAVITGQSTGSNSWIVAGEAPTATSRRIYRTIDDTTVNGNLKVNAFKFDTSSGLTDTALVINIPCTDVDPSWTYPTLGSQLFFDAADNGLIVVGESSSRNPSTQPDYLMKLTTDGSNDIVWKVAVPYLNFRCAAATLNSDLSAGTLGYVLNGYGGYFPVFSQGDYYVINLTDGSTTLGNSLHLVDSSDTTDIWDSTTNTFFYWNGTGGTDWRDGPPAWYLGWVMWRPGGGAVQTLEDICADMSIRTGLTSADYNYTALAPAVPLGAALIERQPARSFLDAINPAFFFDLTDIGDQIIGTLRSQSTLLLTIPEADLAVGTDPTIITDKISTTRGNDLEIPKDLSINYYDYNHDYQQGSQAAKRSQVTQYSSGRNTLAVPVVMTPGQASNAVARTLYLMWVERSNPIKLSLPPDYMNLTPADVIAAQRDGRNHIIRLNKATLEPSTFAIQIEGVSEDLGIYSITAPPSLTDLTGGTFSSQSVVPIVPPVLAVMDTAPLRTSEVANPGVYLAGSPSVYGGGWDGEDVKESVDNSVFETVSSSTTPTLTTPSTIGTTNTVLGNWPRWTVWDETNAVDVTLVNGALASAPADDLVNSFANLGWFSTGEIIQWRTATLIATHKYRLTGLLRGRFGTDAFLRSHVLGETFVVLNESTMQDTEYAASEIGATRYWEGLNDAPDGTGTSGVQTHVMTTRRLMPFAPYFIKGTRDGGLNLTITGLRRMRWRGRPLWTPPETDLPVTMQIDILSATSPPTVLRTLTATLSGAGSGITDASAFTAYYAAADQVTDFRSAQVAIEIQAYELNAILGRGYGRIAVV